MASEQFAQTLETAIALTRSGHFDEALASLDRLAASFPDAPAVHFRRGLTLQRMDQHAAAATSFTRTLELSPGHPEAHYYRAISRLSSGDMPGGWADYEWRWRTKIWRSRPPPLPIPRWQGEPLHGRRVLVFIEQGMGDAIQFARFLPLLQAIGARPALLSGKPLVKLFQGLTYKTDVVAAATDESFDVMVPLMSLPFVFGITLASIPANIPYLAPPAESAAVWSQRLASHPRPRVGLVWRGNSSHANDANRSVPLQTLTPLLEIEGSVVSLQKDPTAGESEILAKAGVLTPELTDFAETAALIENLDLIISVDTAVAHLSGALGKPTWLLVGRQPDWRWLQDRADTPWYPTMRLFRQKPEESWCEAVAEVRAQLESAHQ